METIYDEIDMVFTDLVVNQDICMQDIVCTQVAYLGIYGLIEGVDKFFGGKNNSYLQIFIKPG